MRIFFDFEFIENGSAFVMEPISLGMVREDEKTLYLEFKDIDWSKSNSWVLENVKPHLFQTQDPIASINTGVLNTRENIAKDVLNFVGEKPEFWAYFADYDWVLLCQLFGSMADLPEGWPYYCLDLKQYMYHTNTTKEELDEWITNQQEHNALCDATWNKKAFDWINQNRWSLDKP